MTPSASSATSSPAKWLLIPQESWKLRGSGPFLATPNPRFADHGAALGHFGSNIDEYFECILM